MLEIKVTIEAEGLSQAISKLADALKGSVILSPGGVETQLKGVHVTELEPINAEIIRTGIIPNPNGPDVNVNKGFDGMASALAHTEALPERQAVSQNAVDQKPVEVATQQQGFMNPPVQTTAPVIDLETISRAGAALIDQGKMNDVLALLKQFGVQAVNLLDPSQFPAFAEGLKALGANI